MIVIQKEGMDPYGLRVSFYTFPPTEEIRVDEFVQWAKDRLEVLKEIDKGISNGCGFTSRLRASLAKFLPLCDRSDIRKDVISHFILRLAFCSTSEHRSWFLKHESALLRHRILEHNLNIPSFLSENNIPERSLFVEEFKSLRTELEICHNHSQAQFSAENYYKVDFTTVLNLISERTVFVKDGYAHVFRDDLLSFVEDKFRNHLSLELSKALKATSSLKSNDNRIYFILKSLAKSHKKKVTYEVGIKQVTTPQQIDSLCKQSFPLCAQNMIRHLKTNHHAKYWTRVQLGLFLKGAGLSLESSLHFWRGEFCLKPGMNSHTFDRQFSRFFGQLYGKEGSKCDWLPYGCAKIISSFTNPAEGEHHGCPYRTLDSCRLRVSLIQTIEEFEEFGEEKSAREKYKALEKSQHSTDIDEIISLANHGNYQVCNILNYAIYFMNSVPDGLSKRIKSENVLAAPQSCI